MRKCSDCLFYESNCDHRGRWCYTPYKDGDRIEQRMDIERETQEKREYYEAYLEYIDIDCDVNLF